MRKTTNLRMAKEKGWQLELLPILIITVIQVCSAQAGAPSATADVKSVPSSESTKSVQAVASSVPNEDYSIGPEDVLAINVWHEPELSRIVPVRPDGKISLPLIGDMQASGRSPRDLGNVIAKALQAYIAKPEVAVMLQEVKSQKYNIVGEVLRPGTFVLSNPTTVLDALSSSGGFKDFAKVTHIYILRSQPNGSQIRLPFNYK